MGSRAPPAGGGGAEAAAADADPPGGFCKWLLAHPAFCDLLRVPADYMADEFHHTGLRTTVEGFAEALALLLDEGYEYQDDFFNQTAINAVLLYGLLHARFATTRFGQTQMRERFMAGQFGSCPSHACDGFPVLPIGMDDSPRREVLRYFCPRCREAYRHRVAVDHSSWVQRATVDGAFYGTTAAHLLLLNHKSITQRSRAPPCALDAGGADEPPPAGEPWSAPPALAPLLRREGLTGTAAFVVPMQPADYAAAVGPQNAEGHAEVQALLAPAGLAWPDLERALREPEAAAAEAAGPASLALLHAHMAAHRRFLGSPRGCEAAREMYKARLLGCCPRRLCSKSTLLMPVGLSSQPDALRAARQCTVCHGVYQCADEEVPATLDGAWFPLHGAVCDAYLAPHASREESCQRRPFTARVFGFRVNEASKTAIVVRGSAPPPPPEGGSGEGDSAMPPAPAAPEHDKPPAEEEEQPAAKRARR